VALKGALHAHSTCSDGVLSIAELAWTYAELGFDFLAVTDHDYLLRADCYEREGLGRDLGILVLRGVELTLDMGGMVHVSRIFGEREVLHVLNHPASLYLSAKRLRERIARVAERYPLDAVEVTDRGYPTREIEELELPYVKVATDDAHYRDECGRAWIEVESACDPDAILRAIKEGRFRNAYRGR
jgi:hypothetical protein